MRLLDPKYVVVPTKEQVEANKAQSRVCGVLAEQSGIVKFIPHDQITLPAQPKEDK